MNNQVEENYAGHVVIKSFNKEQDAIDDFEVQNNNYYQSAWKAQFISGIIMPLMMFLNNIGYVFVAIIGGIDVANGNVSLGEHSSVLAIHATIFTTDFTNGELVEHDSINRRFRRTGL